MHLTSSIRTYLNQLSSDQPTPGGGGTLALVAALGMSLAIMVGTIVSKRLPKRTQQKLNRTLAKLKRLQNDAAKTIDSDPEVYRKVMASYAKLRKVKKVGPLASRNGRLKRAEQKVEATLADSFRAQFNLAHRISEAKQLLRAVGAVSKGSIRNDLIVSSVLLDGAFWGACVTAQINVVYMKKGTTRRQLERDLLKLETGFKRIRFE